MAKQEMRGKEKTPSEDPDAVREVYNGMSKPEGSMRKFEKRRPPPVRTDFTRRK
jgi:hypothetical protein